MLWLMIGWPVVAGRVRPSNVRTFSGQTSAQLNATSAAMQRKGKA